MFLIASHAVGVCLIQSRDQIWIIVLTDHLSSDLGKLKSEFQNVLR